jgi:hypothetical protein
VRKDIELEPEEAWLRHRLRRLRALLRHVKDPEAISIVRELMVEAEERLDLLEKARTQEMLK